MAAAPLIAMGVGSAFQAVGAFRQGEAEAMAGEYNAQVAEQNSEMSRIQGIEDERRQRIQGAKALGSTRAAYGASGVTLEGSPLDVLEESARNAEMDALTVRHQGEMRTAAYKQEAEMSRIRGATAKANSFWTGASSLLMGAGQVGYYASGGAPLKWGG